MKCSTYSLGELAKIKYGKNQKHVVSDEGKIPIYGTGGIMGYATEFLYDKPSVLIGRKGTIGKVKYADHPFWTVDTLFYTEVNEEIVLPKFLFYLMSQLDLNVYNEGTTIPSLRTETLNRLDFTIPPLPIQRKIASILSSLDDKIETNNAICRNLEELARTLYAQWYDKRKNECHWVPLESVANINPEAYSVKEQWEYANYLDTGNITDGVISSIQKIDLSCALLPSRARRKIKAGDIVFSTVRPNQRHFGILHSPLPNMLVSTGFTVIRSNKRGVSNELIYLLLSDSSFVEKMQQIGEQSVSAYPSVKPTDIAACLIPLADTEEFYNLQRTIVSMFALIGAMLNENARLADIRDAFLPKLMKSENGI